VKSLDLRFRDMSIPPFNGKRIAVIDIGSSMVRMIIVETKAMYPHLLVHHKVWTALAKGKGEGTFVLSDKAMKRTKDALNWFSWTARQVGAEGVVAVASSAMREAENGEAFAAEIEKEFGFGVHIISGEEEAALAGEGALAGMPDASGIVLDLGGGSLELSECSGRRRLATFPLGILSLKELSNHTPRKAQEIVEKAISEHDWLPSAEGRDLIVLGSGMRTLARMHMSLIGYPLNILHDYRIKKDDAATVFGDLVDGKLMMDGLSGMTPEWKEVLPYRAAALIALMNATGMENVRFGTFGLREGVLFTQCGYETEDNDLLLTYATEWANRSGFGAEVGLKRARWILDHFSCLPDRLVMAASLMVECGWREQATGRGHTVFERILEGPYVGCSHKDRMFIGLCTYFRHEDELLPSMMPLVHSVHSERVIQQAKLVGALLRLCGYLNPAGGGDLENVKLHCGGDYCEIMNSHMPETDEKGPVQSVLKRIASFWESGMAPCM